jgi:hypothetical protein
MYIQSEYNTYIPLKMAATPSIKGTANCSNGMYDTYYEERALVLYLSKVALFMGIYIHPLSVTLLNAPLKMFLSEGHLHLPSIGQVLLCCLRDMDP